MAVENHVIAFNFTGVTLGDLRELMERAALFPDDTRLRVKLVPFKEVLNSKGQPAERISVDTAPTNPRK